MKIPSVSRKYEILNLRNILLQLINCRLWRKISVLRDSPVTRKPVVETGLGHDFIAIIDVHIFGRAKLPRYQCFGSVLISIRIRIRHFGPIRIRIRIWIQVFLWAKCKKFFFSRIIWMFFPVTNSVNTLIEDYQPLLKTIRPSAKWSLLFLTWNHRFFFLFGHHFDCPGFGSRSVFPIRIRIPGSHFNMDPHGSGSETLKYIDIQFHLNFFIKNALN